MHISHVLPWYPVPVVSFESPIHFGRYELLELLGEGAMAQVYRSRLADRPGAGEFAIKRLRLVKGRNRSQMEALINEARNGARLDHPNIVKVHDFGVMDGSIFLAMEHVRGWSVESLLQRFLDLGDPISEDCVIDLGRQVAAGLEHAHGAVDDKSRPMGLVHRDLKPDNVFLRRDGLVKVLDFGIAKSSANLTDSVEQEGRVQGSPLYMSPEQVRGATLDARSDLFSLGSMLAELVLGVAPFQGFDVRDTLQRVARCDWAEVRQQLPAVAPRLSPLIELLLHGHPDDRPQSAGEVLAELERISEIELPGRHTLALAHAVSGRELPAELSPLHREELLDLQRRLRASGMLLQDPGPGVAPQASTEQIKAAPRAPALPAAPAFDPYEAIGSRDRMPTLAIPRDELRRATGDAPEESAPPAVTRLAPTQPTPPSPAQAPAPTAQPTPPGASMPAPTPGPEAPAAPLTAVPTPLPTAPPPPGPVPSAAPIVHAPTPVASPPPGPEVACRPASGPGGPRRG